ncbi:unnamed protein product [Rotaria socialis]|uniref:CxC5 like cysteine cluster associated with KDZ domain-containing protein n=1 Tax=Rotaria socialis TaxID=392032 RepID=A0A821RX81_9BILA|nr:unnamed protein product [Rotaria socialis]
MSHKVDPSSSIDRYSINVMPFTNVCRNMNCQGQSLDIVFSRTGHIANLNSMEPCSIYTSTCRHCKCVYGPSSILDSHNNQRIITTQSIQDIDYVYFSGDLVYSRHLLAMFSNSLIHAHTTFQGFAESYISTLVDLDANQTSIYSANTFGKRLGIVWLYYELSRFIFVTSCETSISFPKSFQPEARPIFIEQNLPFIFHIFTVFWSNHRMLNGIKCKEKLCSRVMLIDGHQKCQRIICQFENLINMNHPEMGPVVQGCPYAPNRKKKNEKGNVIRTFTHSDQSVFYCSHHAKYVDMTKNGEQHHTNQYEEANKIDQQTIAELNNEDICNVYRSDIRTDQKNRSFGFLVTFLSCNVVVSFTESIKSEGCRRVTDHLLTMLKSGANLPDVLFYDNACALRLHWNKVLDTKYLAKNEFTNKLYNLLLVLDRFHRKGHTRPMCRKMMNPDDDRYGTKFKDINTSVCEQFFSFLTKFRCSLRGFNYPTSTLFSLLLSHLKNCHTTGIKQKGAFTQVRPLYTRPSAGTI